MMHLFLGNVIPDFSSPAVWLSLLTLTFLEVVLGIDNIIFISILAAKLPRQERKKTVRIGLILALAIRVVMLFGITWLTSLVEPLIHFDLPWLKAGFSGQSLILIAGGLFLLYKSTKEIYHKMEVEEETEAYSGKARASFIGIILQIALIDMVFSFDSILTAVGMTHGEHGSLAIMIIAVILSILVMMFFAMPVGNFVNKHPSLQMLALSFLIMIGFLLMAEGAHHAHLEVAGSSVGTIPKTYLYFAIAFSLGVEMLNMRVRRKPKPVQLHGPAEEAAREGIKLEDPA